jgi:hypothetical protein
MANVLHNDVLDSGLSVIDNLADGIFLVSQDPANYTEATSTYALGSKTYAPGAAFTSPEPGTPNGRAVSSAVITDGSVSATGTATGWAVVDSVNSKLYANGDLAASQAVVLGNTFQLPSFKIRIPNQ